MNGAHDMGGMMGFGPVRPEANEPVFHAPWEARVFAMMVAASVPEGWTLDEDRHACENRPPADYISFPYYRIWLEAFSTLLVAHGNATQEEIATGKMSGRPGVHGGALAPADVEAYTRARTDYERSVNRPARFKIGEKVRARNIHPEGHTRLPRYLRGHAGEIVAIHGAHVFPDSNAHRKGEDPHYLYTVRFAASEVFGNGRSHVLQADLWEPYLEGT